MIAGAPGKSTSRNFPKLLATTLGEESVTVRVGKLEMPGAFVAGDPDWHRSLPPPPPAVARPVELAPLDPAALRRSLRLPARRPSDEKAGVLEAAKLLALDGDRSAVEFGRMVHALFAEVEWAGRPDIARWEATWLARARDQPGLARAVEVALAGLRAPELAGVWTRPTGVPQAGVWRERTFEVVLEGAWVTGVLDRVVIERDAAGRAIRAAVFDFKTDRIENDAAVLARYAGQLEPYRQAVAKLAVLPVPAVTCELVLTHSRRRLFVPERGR